MLLGAQFNGPARYQVRATASVGRAVAQATLRRELKGPRLPGWNWAVELWTEVLREHLRIAFAMPDANEARHFLDAVVLGSPALSQVNITPVADEKIRASWFVPNRTQPGVTLLYLHGGGFSFYPKAHAGYIAMIAVAAKARTLALDYRLTPEHSFPAQLHDALTGYRWLLDSGADPGNLVVGGDSAGGNLAITLLLAARDVRMPLPKLAFALSPPTDFEAAAEDEGRGTSLAGNEEFDWIDRKMLTKWSDWYCQPGQRRHAYVSPACADLRDLPPIYIQAGRAEILYDSIAAFAAGAQKQGADVTLDSWADMNHIFQMFGDQAPQSAEALSRLGEVIDLRVRGRAAAL